MTLLENLRYILATTPEKVVFIVGAGVSVGAVGSTFKASATWAGLLENGLRRAHDIGRIDGKTLEIYQQQLQLTYQLAPLGVADVITHGLGAPASGEFSGWLRETVGSFHRHIDDSAVLDALAEHQSRGALLATTNYDHLLEAATGLRPVTWRHAAAVGRAISGKDPRVLHLHGEWEEPESIVLGMRTYIDVVRDKLAQTVLATLRTDRTFVFVGCGAGLSDPNLGAFLQWTGEVFHGLEDRHFRLCRRGEVELLRREHPPEQCIFPLPYGGDHADLAPFLRDLLGERPVVTLPHAAITPPREVVAGPPVVIAPPRAVIAPREVVAGPPVVIAPPRAIIAPPREVVAGPPVVIASPPTVVRPPAFIAPPSVTDIVSPPSATLRSKVVLVSVLFCGVLGVVLWNACFVKVAPPGPEDVDTKLSAGNQIEETPAAGSQIEETPRSAADAEIVGIPESAAIVPRKLLSLPLQMDIARDATVMDSSGDAPSAMVSTNMFAINVSTVTDAYPSDFAGAKKSIEGDPNTFKKFTKQEKIEGGWHLEYELASMMDQAPLYGVEIRKTIDGKQYSCSRNDRNAANRDAIAEACLTLRRA